MTGFIYQQWCMLLQHSYSDLLIVEQVQSKFLIEGKLLDTLPASVGILETNSITFVELFFLLTLEFFIEIKN